MVLLARLLEPLDGHQLPGIPVATPEHGPVGALAELAELLVCLCSLREKKKKVRSEKNIGARERKSAAASDRRAE